MNIFVDIYVFCMFNYLNMFYMPPEDTSIKMSRHSCQVKMHAALTLGIYNLALEKVNLLNK